MEMTVPCSTHQLVWNISKKPEPRLARPRYPVRERHQLPGRASYAENVIKRRRKKFAAQSFSRLAAEVQAVALARRKFNAWLQAAEKMLNHFARLESNWDGYGAERINPVVIREARELITRIADRTEEAPIIVPTSRGAIQLEWHRGSRCLELEFESQAMIHYLMWDPTAGVEEEDVVPIYAEDKILRLLEWFENK